jgi:protocatechuate 3,4-dioxygenase beta subunit
MPRAADPTGHDDHAHEHDLGLAHDLPVLLSRRRALTALAGGLGVALAGCGGSGGGAAATTAATTGTGTAGTTSTAASAATAVPEETAGPFPGDGSNGPDVLAESGVVRRDITRSFGDASGTAAGVPATIELTLLDVAAGGTPLSGAAVYVWHCDRAGRYSLYDGEIAGENYLRGVQVSDDRGRLSFATVFPAAYDGRWPHVHFEVYESLDAATKGGEKLRTSQLAIPQDACDAVYATAGYESSAQNMGRTTLESDMVFADGYRSQLATVTGGVEGGMTMSLNVGV